MRKITALALAALMIVGLSGAKPGPVNAHVYDPDRVEEMLDRSVALYDWWMDTARHPGQGGYFRMSQTNFCSGVKMGPRMALSAGHCLEMGQRVAAVDRYGRVVLMTTRHSQKPQRRQDILAADFAVLTPTYGGKLVTSSPIPVRCSLPLRTGETIYLVGSPGIGLRYVVAEGTVATTRSLRDDPAFQHYVYGTNRGGPGTSGGAYYDDYGNLVGLVRGRVGSDPASAYSVITKIEPVCKYLMQFVRPVQ